MGYNVKQDWKAINKQLRRKFDADDPRIYRGMKVGGSRRGAPERNTPEWVNNNAEVRAVLLRSFPKLATDPKQQKAAGRWAKIIHMYWRQMLTHGQIVQSLNQVPFGHEDDPPTWTLSKVRALIHRIRKAAESGHRHRGRPRSNRRKINAQQRLRSIEGERGRRDAP